MTVAWCGLDLVYEHKGNIGCTSCIYHHLIFSLRSRSNPISPDEAKTPFHGRRIYLHV